MQGNIIFSHNTDLKLLKTIAASPFQWQMPKPQNIRQLTSLLKRKTQSVRNNYNQIQSSRHWLIYNGVNIGSIYKDIQNAPKQSSSQSSVKDNNPKYHQNLSIHQFSEYFNKAYEQCTFNLRKHVMNTKKQKDRFMYRQIDWMMHLQGSQRYNASWKCIRNMQHKEKYIKIVSQILKKQKRRDNLSQLLMNEFQKTFYNENNNYLWKIISHQLENFSQKFKIDHNLEKMYFKSLILIEQQFKLRLNQQDIERYVKINYFDRVYEQGLKYQTTWAKAWLYMMSGLHNQAISVIQSNHSDYRQFIQAYTESYEAVRNHKPVQAKLSAKIRINDVFYDQMIICLNGQTKFSNKKLFDFDSLQLVWLVMRTTAIFWNTNKQKKQKFIKLRSQMVKKYRNYLSNPNILRYMLYMLDYESIIVMGQSLLNKDDLLHLLIVLQDYPGFFKNINIQKILSQKLTIMIRQMMIQRKQQCIYYIALMPTQAFAIQISKLIVAFYNLDEFNWQQMKELISKSAYQELVESSIYLCAQKSHNYYACGLKLMNLLGQVSHVIKYFIRILIRHHLDEKQFSFQQIQQIQQEGLKLSVLKEPYMKVFQFFSCIRLFKQVFMRQGSMKMQTLVTNNLLVFIDKRQVLNFIQVVQQINECSGIEIYFEFIRDLVYQAQIYFSKINNNQQFKLLKHLISRTCLNILQQQTLKKHRNNIKVQQTMNYLQLNS